MSTQPPSFAHRHPRHLSVFYHHHRSSTTSRSVYLARRLRGRPRGTRRAPATLVRELDQPRLERSAGSSPARPPCAERLARFNGLTNVQRVPRRGRVDGPTSRLDAGPPRPATGPVLSVGPPRVPQAHRAGRAAAHLLPGTRCRLVGTGGRVAWARALDHRLATTERRPRRAHRRRDSGATPARARRRFREGFRSPTSSSPAGSTTPTSVAPLPPRPVRGGPGLRGGLRAHRDRGHAVGRPVIVCTDGGGLAELVDHGVTGLVVEPTRRRSPRPSSGSRTDPASPPSWAPTGGHRAAELRLGRTPPTAATRRGRPGAGVKIAVIAPSPVPFTRGGAERRGRALARAIERAHAARVPSW